MTARLGRREFLEKAALAAAAVGSNPAEGSPSVPEIPNGFEYDPWRTWRQGAGNGPLGLVRAAILASNALNAQPWLFGVAPSRIDVYADRRRNLGLFDPYFREMHLSVGCAIENLMLAAKANGYRASPALMAGKLDTSSADPSRQLVAQIALESGPTVSDELYQAIPHRHTNRHLFDTDRPLPEGFAKHLQSVISPEDEVRLFVFTDPQDRRELSGIIERSANSNLDDTAVRSAMQTWFRTTQMQLRASRDGEFVPKAAMPGAQTSDSGLLGSARLFGIVAVRDRYERILTLRAGRVWQRLHLLATARNLAARVHNAAVERIDHEKRLSLPPQCAGKIATLTGLAEWQPTLMFYMGYPTVPATAAVRRPVEDVLI